MKSKQSKTKIVVLSGVTIALYVVVMYFTQTFAFGQYQIRIATSLYSMSYFFPFLVIPLGMANLLSNLLLGGLGFADVAGGIIVGVLTSGSIYLVRRFELQKLLIIPILILIPGLGVPVWLSPILGAPYFVLAISICIGQILPAILGYIFVRAIPQKVADRL